MRLLQDMHRTISIWKYVDFLEFFLKSIFITYLFRFPSILSHNDIIKLSSFNITTFVQFQVFTVLGFASIQIGEFSHIGISQFYSSIAMICFWFTAILLVLYLFQVTYVFARIPWSKIEFYFCLTATLFLMLVSSLVAARGVTSLTVAAVSILLSLILLKKKKIVTKMFCLIFQFFGYVAMCAYGYDTFLKYKLFGTTTTIVSQRTTTVTVA